MVLAMTTQSQAFDEKYLLLDQQELQSRIKARRRELGDALCILGHHYQRDEIVQVSDFVGDSLALSRQAAQMKKARWFVFCGVSFMAESADVLSSDDQAVCLPHLQARCTMAEMADAPAVATAIDEIASISGQKVIPIAYVNSTAAVKAVTGSALGACCTSGNAANVVAWALDQRRACGDKAKILMLPDQHLGRNTAVAMGFAPEDCAVYDPALPDGGLSAQQIQRAVFILWKGHCYVHQQFTVADIGRVRSEYPGVKVVVHPECPHEVVQQADAAGSTEQIIKLLAESPKGQRWAVGTESNLVQRMAEKHGRDRVLLLSSKPAICRQMYLTGLPHLAWVLDNLAAGRVVNRITVEPDVARQARVALDRMISIKPSAAVTTRASGEASATAGPS